MVVVRGFEPHPTSIVSPPSFVALPLGAFLRQAALLIIFNRAPISPPLKYRPYFASTFTAAEYNNVSFMYWLARFLIYKRIIFIRVVCKRDRTVIKYRHVTGEKFSPLNVGMYVFTLLISYAFFTLLAYSQRAVLQH